MEGRRSPIGRFESPSLRGRHVVVCNSIFSRERPANSSSVPQFSEFLRLAVVRRLGYPCFRKRTSCLSSKFLATASIHPRSSLACVFLRTIRTGPIHVFPARHVVRDWPGENGGEKKKTPQAVVHTTQPHVFRQLSMLLNVRVSSVLLETVLCGDREGNRP